MKIAFPNWNYFRWLAARSIENRSLCGQRVSGLKIEACNRCKSDAVVHQRYSGEHLCHKHLAGTIRRRVSKGLREQLQLPKSALKEDGSPTKILVCISGGKDSAVLLTMMCDILGPRRDVELIAGCVDEGIDGYRAPSLEMAYQLAEKYGIAVETISYPELGFEKMDAVVEAMPAIAKNNSDARGMKACSYCGVFRRQGLNALAERVGADWMALGHNLDDMAQTVLMNLQKGEVDRSVRLAPHTWTKIDGLVPRIVPLRWIPEQEIHAYAVGEEIPFFHGDCPHAPGALRQRSREIIAALEAQMPGSRHGLLHSMDAIRQMHIDANGGQELSEGWAQGGMKICEKCGEKTSKPICQACIMRGWLKQSQ